MKKKYSIFILIVWFGIFNSSYAIISTPKIADITMSASKLSVFEMKDVENLSIAEIEAKIAHRLTWKQKLAMKLSKSDDGNAALGFILGLSLGPIGVLIAYHEFRDQSKTIRWAWWGCLVGTLLVIIAFAVFLSAFRITI